MDVGATLLLSLTICRRNAITSVSHSHLCPEALTLREGFLELGLIKQPAGDYIMLGHIDLKPKYRVINSCPS